MAKGKAQDLFRSKAPWIMALLMRDFQLQLDDAAAIVGNLGHESGGFASLQEVKPTVPSSRGGFGWAQWTGPRRRSYEAYCSRGGLDRTTDKANYGFLFAELKGPYRKAIDKLVAAKGLNAKVKAFELAYEQAGVKSYASRNQWAAIALDAWHQIGGNPTLPAWALPTPAKPANAQEPAPTTSDASAAAQPAPSAPPVATERDPQPSPPPAKKTWWQGVIAALGIGTAAGGAGWQFGEWFLFGALGLVVVIVVAVWLHGRKA